MVRKQRCHVYCDHKKHPEVCTHPTMKHFQKLGIEPQALAMPAVAQYVDGATALATPEWELAFTKEMRFRVQYEPISAAICIAHLRAIRQCTASSRKWAWIMEEDAEPTSHFATGIITALLAISGSPTQSNSVHDNPPAIIYLCSSKHAGSQIRRCPTVLPRTPSMVRPRRSA